MNHTRTVAITAAILFATLCIPGAAGDSGFVVSSGAAELISQPSAFGASHIVMETGTIDGDLVTIEIYANDFVDLYGAAFTLLYDPVGTTYVGCEAAGSILLMSPVTTNPCNDALVGGAKFAAALQNGVEGTLNVRASKDGLVPGIPFADGLLVSLTFQANGMVCAPETGVIFEAAPSREVLICPQNLGQCMAPAVAWDDLPCESCGDGDSDGWSCLDCDDGNSGVFPGAVQLCDGINNDCQDSQWPVVPFDEFDSDTDSFRLCDGDCNDGDSSVYPGAAQLCDGINNDCQDSQWPAVPLDEFDADADSFRICDGDCSDDDSSVYPGASQLCDGLNNDCFDPAWPALTGTNEQDDDGDGISECQNDCDDAAIMIYPGAPQTCDGFNNDCDHPSWPVLVGTNEFDDDWDSVSECDGDCDDVAESIYPGADQLCDGVNNDCQDSEWPTVPPDELDSDADGSRICGGDCDDTVESIFPDAPQLCDGTNNDCLDPEWPMVPPDEIDSDADGFRICEGDCDDANAELNPSAIEVCNGIDDDCNLLVDEDALGEDSDGDSINNLCDNCASVFNTSQLDTDSDGVGDVCDNCLFIPNSDQSESDGDEIADACDNCPLDFNPSQDDFDDDFVGNACDNCLFTKNPNQTDADSDFEGDHCDLNDGLIYLTLLDESTFEWQDEIGFQSWNGYRGDLRWLLQIGTYTQAPGSNPLAARLCGLVVSSASDPSAPTAPSVAFYLISGVSGGIEGGLGSDSAGNARPNDNPCP